MGQYPVCVRMTAEAANEHRLMFGALAIKEMVCELSYYLRMHEKAGRIFKGGNMAINYDNLRVVFLCRSDLRFWEVVGFGKADDYCPGERAV